MPKALIIGISNSLAHEKAVRDSFLAYAGSDWDADIIMLTENQSLLNDPLVPYIVLNEVGFVQYNDLKILIDYVDDFPNEYPIVICSYYISTQVFERYVWEKDRLIFMPQQRGKNNVVKVGVGDLQAQVVSGLSETFYKANLLPLSRQLTPSYVTPSVAGICTKLIDDGLTTKECLKAIRQNLTGTWTTQNGYGKFPDSISSEFTNTVEPPNALGISINGGTEISYLYSLFYDEPIDYVNIYRDDELIFSGNGVKTQININLATNIDSQEFYLVNTDWFGDIEVKEYNYVIRAVRNGVESDIQDYCRTTYNVSENYRNFILRDEIEEPSEPEQPNQPEEPRIPEPPIIEEVPLIEPISDPTTPSASRSQKTVTIQRNESSGQMKVFRRLKKSDSPELVATVSETEFEDTVSEFGNYIYNIQYTNEETESTLSEDVYVSGETPPQISQVIY